MHKFEWRDEALEALARAWHDTYPTPSAQRRAALNAAIRAQGIDPPTLADLCAFEAGKDFGREEALEDAAKTLEVKPGDISGVVAAEIVRSLKDKEPTDV
jgi:hypothetical protein